MESSTTLENNPFEGLSAQWSTALVAVVCERCDWTFLAPPDYAHYPCPHCYQASLTLMESSLEGLPHLYPPELLLEFTLKPGDLTLAVERFTRDIPFAPDDLNPKMLSRRLRRVYLPMWLVDADVNATWQAEAGFDYQVVSHQDHFEQYGGGWKSREVTEGRIRWEPRLGTLKRHYPNVAAPALEDSTRLQKALGTYELQQARPYQAETIAESFVRLPDRAPQDAWSDAQPAFQAAAAQECQEATQAGHMRQFSWSPEYANLNWTLLLQPLFTTYYQDDEGRPQPVLIHGQNGRIVGVRRASMKRGQKAALTILAVAMVLFLASLLVSAASLLLPIMLAFGVLSMTAALLVGLGAVYPLIAVWWFNRQQR
ncbi:MAG: hypothetical protein AB1894_20695 [Chloroflexota bacterium]